MFAAPVEIWEAYRRSRAPLEGSSTAVGADRRVFHRVPVRISCHLANPAFGLESKGMTVDISMDGMGLIAPVNWSHGNQIRVTLASIGFQAEAVIAFRIEEAPQFRYGIRFQNTRLSQLIKLRRYLQQYHNGQLRVNNG